MRLWVKVLVSQGWVQSEITVYTIMEQKTEGGGLLRIWNFQGYWRNSKWIFQGLIKNHVKYSGRDQ